jgi:LPPG:FO 2-phospho-L-lactate transferase
MTDHPQDHTDDHPRTDEAESRQRDVAVLCGGVGAARFLRALRGVVDPARVTAIVNTADDTELHGLWISPDLDTITYTLSGEIDPERGWGLRDESWRAMAALARFEAVRPNGSRAAPTWFNLGDLDLATHCYRTGRRREGATLAAITAEIAEAFGVRERLIPMTDDVVSTLVDVADTGERISFQEYFVQRRHSIAVSAVTFAGAAEATAHPDALDALRRCDLVVIAPSNPIVSIGPIRAVAGFDDVLRDRRERCVAISPIVGGTALKGPADRMLVELGHEASVVGVARLYRDVAAVLVIDPVDEHLAAEVAGAGMRPVIVPSVMSTPEIGADLARTVLDAIG